MTLSPGTRLGPYEIVSPLGAGGMGEVWKARDTRLDRFVAVKVLPEQFSRDGELLARFEREAKAVAALSHPNILALHDFGTRDGLAFAVMELLEGETLRARLGAGPLAPRKAVELAVQLAEGLAAAHARGVIHRDLKPENLWVTKEGRLKILDFGLAKQTTRPGPGSGSDSMLQTAALGSGSAHETASGTILGTVGYMSPEQVRGEAVDARSDLFSFGVVLYEMLTGTKAFVRATTGDTLAAILRDDPPEFEATARPISAGLRRIVSHCLEKDPARRFQQAQDLAFALEGLSGGSDSGAGIGAQPAPASDTARPKRSIAWIPAAAAGLVLGAAVGAFLLRPSDDRPPVAIRALTFTGADASPSTSPDGKTIAFTSWRDGTSRIYVKQLKGGEEKALTEGPDDSPRFSPDGTTILFARQTGARPTLFRISLLGDEPKVVAPDAVFGDWSPDGSEVVFVRVTPAGDELEFSLVRVPAGGGAETVVAKFGKMYVGAPRWSPDGRRVALTHTLANAAGGAWSVRIVDLADGRQRSLLAPTPSGALSIPAWVDATSLVGVQSESPAGNGTAVSAARVFRLDVDSGDVRVLVWLPSSCRTVDALPDGRLVLDALSGRQNLRLWTLDGSQPPRWLTRGNIADRQPVFAPDGETVAFSSNRAGNLDVWAVSTKSGKVRSLTDDGADDWDPAFSPDGSALLWSSNRGGNLEIWAAGADGSGARQVSHDGEDAENPTQTRDGKWIVYASGKTAAPGLMLVRPDGSEERMLVPGTNISLPEVSPDGEWVVFRTNDLVDARVAVARLSDGRVFPFATVKNRARSKILTGGRSRWTPDGRAILSTGEDEEGRSGVFVQDFVPGKDTSATRRPLAGFDPDWATESLGLSPDGKRLVLSESIRELSLLVVDGLPGLARKGATR